jgi:2,3-dihydroxybiphenyl 1,2-dioxygenase
MTLQALGYIGVTSRHLDDWAAFSTGLLGMQLAERTSSTLRLRMDDRRQRLVVEKNSSDGAGFFGWQVADAAALDALGAKLDAAGISAVPFTPELCEQRRVRDGIAFADPLGNRIEAFHGADVTSEPFVPGRTISGFRTGAMGMGHAVLTVERIDPVLPFYRDILGFRLSDFITRPFKAYFFHLNPRHHSLALIETGRNAMHHFMVELMNLDDVGQGYDLALSDDGRIATTLGRHTNDFMTSFYANTPSGFMVEYGWGGRSIDPATWQPVEMTYGPSLWGHERSRVTPEQRAAAAEMRDKVRTDGLRAPLQVAEGNFEIAPVACAWWDQVAGR